MESPQYISFEKNIYLKLKREEIFTNGSTYYFLEGANVIIECIDKNIKQFLDEQTTYAKI